MSCMITKTETELAQLHRQWVGRKKWRSRRRPQQFYADHCRLVTKHCHNRDWEPAWEHRIGVEQGRKGLAAWRLSIYRYRWTFRCAILRPTTIPSFNIFGAGYGGFGLTSRLWGLTLDTIQSIHLVRADGSIITASHEENCEIFWVGTSVILSTFLTSLLVRP
jgi:hypothetical protein